MNAGLNVRMFSPLSLNVVGTYTIYGHDPHDYRQGGGGLLKILSQSDVE